MAIKTGQSTGIVAVLTADTIGDEAGAGESHEHYAAYLNNTNSSGTVSVEVFLSADSSSSVAEQVFEGGIAFDDPPKRLPVVTVDASSHLLLKGDATGVNFYSTYTKRTGDDV